MTVEYQRRLEKHYDELKWLYCELYPNGQGRFEELCAAMEQWYKERNKKWKALDRKREKQKDWYKSQKMLGMMLYIDAFADNISGLEKKLDYLNPLLEMGLQVYLQMSTFEETNIEKYEILK